MKLTIPLLLIMCASVMAQHQIEPPSGGFVNKAISEGKPVVKKPIAGQIVQWLPLTQSDDQDWFYRPSDQLFRKNGNVGLWIMAKEHDKSGYSMNFWIVRCAARQIMLLQFTNYTKNHRITYKSGEYEANWQDIKPDTLFGETHDKVCRGPKNTSAR